MKIIFFILVFSNYLSACEVDEVLIDKIDIIGLKKTQHQVINDELEFKQGECVKKGEIDLALGRIRNTNLFTKVEFISQKHGEKINLKINIVERWTLVPIIKFGGGGGVSYFAFGLYDPNIFGKNLEMGAQIESLGGTPSQVIWFRKPRFLKKRIRVGADIWNSTRNRSLYNKNREEIGGFTLERKRVNAFLEYEIKDFVKPYIAFDYQDDKTSEMSLLSETKKMNEKYQFNPFTHARYLIMRPGLYLGRMNILEELIEGEFVDFQYELVKCLNQGMVFSRPRLEAQWAKVLPYRGNFHQRLIFTTQSINEISQLFYLGSIQDVRGLVDSQFQTRKYAIINSEYRVPSIVKSYLLQHAFFSDALSFEQDKKWEKTISFGTGLRLIFPKIYRLNLRLDWARSFGYGEGSAVSFGLQQFY